MFAASIYIYVLVYEATDEERAIPLLADLLVDEELHQILYLDIRVVADCAALISAEESALAKVIAERTLREEIFSL